MAAKSDIENPAKSGDAAPRAAPPFNVVAAMRAELPMIVGLVVTAVVYAVGRGWAHDVSNLPFTAGLFVVLFGVMIWCAFGVVALVQSMQATELVKIGIAITGVYLFFIGGIMQLFPNLGARKV